MKINSRISQGDASQEILDLMNLGSILGVLQSLDPYANNPVLFGYYICILNCKWKWISMF